MNHELFSNTNTLLKGNVFISKVIIFKIRKQNLKVKVSVIFRLTAPIFTLKVLYYKRNIEVIGPFHLSIFNSINHLGLLLDE